MGWLEDLIGVTPQGQNGFEDWMTPPDFSFAMPDFGQIQQGGLDISKLISPFQYDEPFQPQNALQGPMDIYHGLMRPFGSGKELVDQSVGLLTDNTPLEVSGPNEAGQVAYNINKEIPLSPANALDQLGNLGGTPGETFMDKLGSGIYGMATDPMTYALPEAPGALFAPGMVEQVSSGLQQGGPEGYADALLGAGGLGLIGLGHANDLREGFNNLADVTRPGQEGSIKNPFSSEEPIRIKSQAELDLEHEQLFNLPSISDLEPMTSGEIEASNRLQRDAEYKAKMTEIMGKIDSYDKQQLDYYLSHPEQPKVEIPIEESPKVVDPNQPVQSNPLALLDKFEAQAARDFGPEWKTQAPGDVLDVWDKYINKANEFSNPTPKVEGPKYSSYGESILAGLDQLDNQNQALEVIPPEATSTKINIPIADKAILIPFSKDGKIAGYEWNINGKPVGEFATREEALANRPAANEHLDEAYQPFPEDIAKVIPREQAPVVSKIARSGADNEVIIRFDPTDKPLTMAEVNGLFPDAQIAKYGNDAFLDSPGQQKFKLYFKDKAGADAALSAFGENTPIRDLGSKVDKSDVIGKAEPDTSALNSHVEEMKAKYGDRAWRNKMTPSENTKFQTLQNEVAGISKPILPEIQSAKAFDQTNLKPERAYLPPAEPPIKIPEPPKSSKPEPPLQQLNKLSALDSAVKPTGSNLEHINKDIGERVKAYDKLHEEAASKDIYTVREATQGVNKAGEQKIIRFLDGEKVVLDSHEMQVATKLRKMLDDVATRAEAEQVLVGYRKGYFPRKYADRWEWETSPSAFKGKDAPYGNLEKSRTTNKENFRRDFKVLEEYANDANRRIAEAKYLGKDLNLVTGKQFTGDRNTVNYLNKALGRLTGRSNLSGDISTRVSRTFDIGRKITALGDLTFAALYQPGQITATASQVGFRRALRGVVETMKNYGGEKLNATRSGALWPNISHEVSKAMGSHGYMHGIPTLDAAMRVHANVTGRLLVEDALNGNSYAKRQIESLGLDLKDPNIVDQAGKAISDKTQLRTGTLDMPLWTHSPYGKIASQYSSFAYAHTKMVMDMFKHPVQNLGQIARFAAIGVMAGEGVADLREAIKALIPGKGEDDDVVRRMIEAAAGENFDNKSWARKLQAATRSKRISFDNPAWRAVQNLSMIGGAGIFQSIAEKATSGEYWQIPLGPMGSLGIDTAEAARKDIGKIGSGDYRFKESQRNLLKNAPIPFVSGNKLANYVLPPNEWYLNPDLQINLDDYFGGTKVQAP